EWVIAVGPRARRPAVDRTSAAALAGRDPLELEVERTRLVGDERRPAARRPIDAAGALRQRPARVVPDAHEHVARAGGVERDAPSVDAHEAGGPLDDARRPHHLEYPPMVVLPGGNE